MLSRVADSLYWTSRYLERAENTVRQLDVTMSLMLDPGGATTETRWRRMMAALGGPPGMEWNGDLESMARALIFDRSQPCFRHLLRERGAGERAPGAGRDFNGAVAAAEPAVPPDPFAEGRRAVRGES